MNFSLLKGASKFPAIQYSEEKIEKSQKAGLSGKDAWVELIAVKNFPVKNAASLPYWAKEQIMLDWCRKSGVSIRQLHFSVSCRGGENTEDELKAAAEHLLIKMGYARCPTLFYIHRDTDNLHLHVVTTKCDENGKKIPDWRNGQRFRECLDQYEGRHTELNADHAIREAFSYHFTEERHFVSLLATMGFHTHQVQEEPTSTTVKKTNSTETNNQGMLLLLRNRKKMAEVRMEEVRRQMELNRLKAVTETEIHRKKELSAIMHDYRKREFRDFYTGKKPITKSELRIEQKVRAVSSIHSGQMVKRGIMKNDLYQMALFQSDIKKVFGLDVIYNFDRTGVPNGFIVLDHQAKRVWRGSELGFKFKDFLRPNPKALTDFIDEERCSEALTHKDNDLDEGFRGAVGMETRNAKGETVFLFYGRFNVALLPDDLGKNFIYREIPYRCLNQEEMKALRKRRIEVRIHQSVYDSIPFTEPFDADEARGAGASKDDGLNLDTSTMEGVAFPRLNIKNVGDVVESTVNAVSGMANAAIDASIDLLDNMLDTPTSMPSVGGGQAKDLESLEAKKRRKRKR